MNVKEVIGTSYKTASGKVFKVLKAESYPASKVSHKYKSILDFKKEYLVAVGYRGTLIPNITMDGGVARITTVEVDGKVFDRPGAISKALGVKDDMTSYLIKKVA